ncbi:metallophosphoesterase [Olivibacter sp. SDN3]|uniref:metallophosphoesterase family protein n=1 Tax=Olivibacter sp. SDN3 TaxID=2764720 RepID=UPI0016518712|nr:metallophosphoesterase [Olivibacter sp. SDN3]QNL49402.1 metallophosphoesterase [Olivibacter sp. SDN3]
MIDVRNKPLFLKEVPQDVSHFLEAPTPSGSYPYELDISQVTGNVQAIDSRMLFHMVGDTGSLRHSDFQQLVANELALQINNGSEKGAVPSFLFHLGDVVYNHGEVQEYPRQFFVPYEIYPAPIFALAGNHDADINPITERPYESLYAFRKVFCDTKPREIAFSGGSTRKSMIQPHVFWVLKTPLANFIALYSNIPKFGYIPEEQKSWFIDRLKEANKERPNKALIVCLHHAPYSADTNHGSSKNMIQFLETSFLEADVRPDIVFSGHVHNYQRFSKQYPDGTTVPFIVAGAGGYADLHRIAQTDDNLAEDDDPVFDGVQLENYCDDRYGFLKIAMEKTAGGLQLIGQYYTIPKNALQLKNWDTELFEQFRIPIIHRECSVQ